MQDCITANMLSFEAQDRAVLENLYCYGSSMYVAVTMLLDSCFGVHCVSMSMGLFNCSGTAFNCLRSLAVE
jgi:hypothetical protein